MNAFEVIETPLDLARDLADLAKRLDEFKFQLPREKHASTLALVETMYDMAEILAGNRAEEIIGESDGSEETRRQPE